MLDSILAMIGAEDRALLCAVMLLDQTGQRLDYGASAGLPEDFRAATESMSVAHGGDPRTDRVSGGEWAFGEDLGADTLCERLREVALHYGMRSCWVFPIVCRTGVAGVLAVYRLKPGTPSSWQTGLMQTATYLAGIAVERDREQEHLDRQAAVLRQQADLIQAAHDAILVLDLDHRVAFWNRGAEETYGWTAEEALGKVAPELLQTRFPVPLEEVDAQLRRSGQWIGELGHTRKDGRQIVVESRWVLSEEPGGGPPRVLEINRDITERKQAEVEVTALNARLRRAMAETHHRVKNNLQVISALVDLQLMRGEESVPVRELDRLGQHIRSLAAIHDLLTQQARAGGAVYCVAVRDAVDRLMPMLQSMTRGRTIRADVQNVELPTRQGTALAVLMNELVANAIKHGEGDIEVTFTTAGGKGRLIVADHGPGFPPGFDPRLSAHTGVDLTESVGRWDLQGTVAYMNREPHGAMVVVEFPLGDAAHGSEPDLPFPQAPAA